MLRTVPGTERGLGSLRPLIHHPDLRPSLFVTWLVDVWGPHIASGLCAVLRDGHTPDSGVSDGVADETCGVIRRVVTD